MTTKEGPERYASLHKGTIYLENNKSDNISSMHTRERNPLGIQGINPLE